MLSRCANPECGKPFANLREGKLFVIETADSFHIRRQKKKFANYWLCDECATTWTLIYDLLRGISLVPLRRPMALSGAEDRNRRTSSRARIH